MLHFGVTSCWARLALDGQCLGVWYESRTDTHNMYKEFREVTINGAVSQLYSEMAGRHRANPGSYGFNGSAMHL